MTNKFSETFENQDFGKKASTRQEHDNQGHGTAGVTSVEVSTTSRGCCCCLRSCWCQLRLPGPVESFAWLATLN